MSLEKSSHAPIINAPDYNPDLKGGKLVVHATENGIILERQNDEPFMSVSSMREQTDQMLEKLGVRDINFKPGQKEEDWDPTKAPGCANCLIEQGIKPHSQASHGVCERHEQLYYEQRGIQVPQSKAS